MELWKQAIDYFSFIYYILNKLCLNMKDDHVVLDMNPESNTHNRVGLRSKLMGHRIFGGNLIVAHHHSSSAN